VVALIEMSHLWRSTTLIFVSLSEDLLATTVVWSTAFRRSVKAADSACRWYSEHSSKSHHHLVSLVTVALCGA
jgi:hypothetical protein